MAPLTPAELEAIEARAEADAGTGGAWLPSDDVLALVGEVRRLTAALAAADALADAAWQDIHDDEAAPLHAQMATRVTLAAYDKALGRPERRR